MVQDVFATEDCDVEIIDLDCVEDYDERDKLEDYASEIRNSDKFKNCQLTRTTSDIRRNENE